MKILLDYFKKISRWGLRPEYSETQQRTILMFNRIMMIASVILTIILSIFFITKLYQNFLFIASYEVLLIVILILNKNQKFYISRIIISIFPLLIVFMSVITKITGATSVLEFVFAPYNAAVVLSFFVMLLIDLRKKSHWLLLIPSFLSVVFFQEIHQIFGINIFDYNFGINIFVVRISYIFILMALLWGMNSLQAINSFFDNKIKDLLYITSQKNEELALQNEIISHKNRQITDSIRYALRIQEAILGNPENIQKLFPESFVFFRPKDIVSGDFYWFYQHQNLKIVMVADCTGHGVSGAFMTVLGHDLLESIIKNEQIFSPAAILTELDRRILAILQKESNIQDGMDMSILCIESDKMLFAGAKNPLYFIQNHEFQVIRGAKFPIGSSHFQQKSFENHQLNLDTTTICYIFSDGFEDQFGGEHDRKFLSKRFKELLFSIHTKSLTEQKLILEQTLQTWKGNTPQTDDILVIGLKI